MASKISSIALTDKGTPSLSVTYRQYTSDATLLSKISGRYGLVVTGAPVSAAATLQADSCVTGFSIADTASNVAGSIDRLQAMTAKITSITLTDSGKPSLAISATQFTADNAVLAKIRSAYTGNVAVSGTVTNRGTLLVNGGTGTTITLKHHDHAEAPRSR